MSRLLVLTLLAAVAGGCSGRRSGPTPTPSRDPSPPLTRSDRDAFQGLPPAPPDVDGGGGAGAGNGGSGTAIGNAGSGNRGGSGGSSGGQKGAAVPEPGTMLLVGSGLAAAALARRRRRAVRPT
ncbi:MAG: PEP-CTERM sorting domain-containing protein [Planctomycetota bacterium]